jgi:prenyltransferase beta subunit
VHYLTSATSANGVENGTSLAADGYFDTSTDWADFGLTIDGAFALAATGLDNTTLAKVAAFLAEQKTDPSENSVNNWTGIGTEFASGGSIGKEALLAEVTGYNPRNFGGHDLIAALDALVCSGTDSAKGCAGKGNYAYATSTFSQALGLIAQLRAGDTANATDAVTYLEGLQNAAGAWPTLTPNTGGGSDVDSTAMAAMALALLGDDGTASAAVTKAVDWIATQQETDGGFPGTSGDSTNSAALAIQGLTLAGSKYQDQIDRAKTFLAGQQNSDGGFNAASQQGSDVRASTQVVSGLVGTSFGTLSDNIAPAATADRPAAAAYLTGQLVDGTHLNFADGSTPNYGGTADLAMALAAAGGQDATLVKVVTYLRAHVADYADPAGATASFPGPYSGSAAKLALLAEITGQDPSAFGGFDLVAALTDHVCTAADATGSCTAAGDFYQAFSGVSQALGVLALARADRTPPAAAVTRLEQLQCPDGGFSSDLIAPGADCTSDVDTTGYAVQALTQVPDASNAVSKAMSYLLAAQQSDGGYLGAAGENSNSTALAAQGLMAAPAASTLRTARSATARARATAAATPSDAVTVAVAWLAARQNADGGLSILAAGASDPSATAQALVPLAGKTQADLNNPITLAPFTGSGPTSSASPSGGTSPASGGTVPNGSPTVGSPTAGGSGVAGSTDAGSGPLAFTGSGVAGWLTWAGLLLITGAALVVAGRRRWPAWASPGRRP